MKKAVAASGWNQVSEKKKAKIRAQAAALAKRISEGAAPGRLLPYPLFQRVMFLGIKAMDAQETTGTRLTRGTGCAGPAERRKAILSPGIRAVRLLPCNHGDPLG
jgi:hypothetical protein